MELKNKKIVLLSPQDWGELFLSKHHYAVELSKNNLVYFINSSGKRNLRKLAVLRKVNENLIIVDYFNFYFLFARFPMTINRIINYIITKIVSKYVGHVDIVWSFEQSKFFNLKLFNASLVIYHPADFIPQYEKYENIIYKAADFIFSPVKGMLPYYSENDNKYFINHGLSINQLDEAKNTITKSKSQKIKIAYVGPISSVYIDEVNFLKVIDENQHLDFHIIGPIHSSNISKIVDLSLYNKLSIYSNITFHGPISHDKLIHYLSDFDIFFACYNYNKYQLRISNSHKLLEYLVTGKVTVTNYYDSYEGVSDEILIMCKNNSDISKRINEISKNIEFYNSIEKQSARRKYAMKFTYENNIKKIEQIINKKQ